MENDNKLPKQDKKRKHSLSDMLANHLKGGMRYSREDYIKIQETHFK